MKKILKISIICLILFSCKTTPEDKAKFLIREYIDNNANDPDSYEPLSYESLDTQFTFYAKDKSYIDLESQYENEQITFDEWVKRKDSIENNFKEKPIGFMMRHKFRANNGFGAKILSSKVFRFNLDLDSITSVDDTLD